MENKNNIINYFKHNDLEIKNISYTLEKGFIIETNNSLITSKELSLLNYITPHDMEYIKMELNHISIIDKIGKKLIENNMKILNISLDITKNKSLIIHTTKGNITSSNCPDIDYLTIDKIYDLYLTYRIEKNTINDIIAKIIFAINNNIDDLLSSYILHSIVYNLNESNIKDFLTEIVMDSKNEIDVEIFNVLYKKLSYHRELDKNLKDRLTGAFKSDFYHKFLGVNPLKREEDNNNDIITFSAHLNYIYCNSIMYCDLDNFKMINEFLNYSSGDLVLQNFTKIISNFDNKLMIIRKGGDEFIILGNAANLNNLSNFFNTKEFVLELNNGIYSTQDLKGNVKKINIDKKSHIVETTVSYGISFLNSNVNFKNRDEFLLFNKDFRKSLYEAENLLKINKRNKVFSYRELESNNLTCDLIIK